MKTTEKQRATAKAYYRANRDRVIAHKKLKYDGMTDDQRKHYFDVHKQYMRENPEVFVEWYKKNRDIDVKFPYR